MTDTPFVDPTLITNVPQQPQIPISDPRDPYDKIVDKLMADFPIETKEPSWKRYPPSEAEEIQISQMAQPPQYNVIKDDEFIVLDDGTQQVKIPKSAQLKFQAKSGKTLDMTAEDWANDPWGKSEINRKINDIHRKSMDPHEIQKNQLSSLIKDDIENLNGFDWTVAMMKAITNLNPGRANDIAQFLDRIRQNDINDSDLEQSSLRQDNALLKKNLQSQEQQQAQVAVSGYVGHLEAQLRDQLGVDDDQVNSAIKQLADLQLMPNAINDIQTADLVIQRLHNQIIIGKAADALETLNIPQDKQDAIQKEALALLMANPKMEAETLLRKLSLSLEQSNQPLIKKAKEKIERFQSHTGRALEAPIAKPLPQIDQNLYKYMDPIDRVRFKLGLQ